MTLSVGFGECTLHKLYNPHQVSRLLFIVTLSVIAVISLKTIEAFNSCTMNGFYVMVIKMTIFIELMDFYQKP